MAAFRLWSQPWLSSPSSSSSAQVIYMSAGCVDSYTCTGWLDWFVDVYWLTWLIYSLVLADFTDSLIYTVRLHWFHWSILAALISLIYTGWLHWFHWAILADCIYFIDLYWFNWFHWSVLADIIDFIDLYWLHSFHWSILTDLIDFIDLYWLTSLISLIYTGWKVERTGCVAIDLYLNSYYPTT